MPPGLKTNGSVTVIIPIIAIGLTVAASGCGGQSPERQADTAQAPAAAQAPAQTPAEAQAPADGQPQRYDLRGKVVSVDKAKKSLTVDHEVIPGFMGAMTMPYAVKDEHLLDNLKPGEQVTAKVVATSDEYWLEDIAPAR